MHKMTTAFITGATSGIGEALSHILADTHTNLILSGRNEEKLLKLSDYLAKKVHVTPIVSDLTRGEDREILVAAIQRQCPELVINNAGFGLYGEGIFQSTEELIQMMHVNCTALMELTIESAKTLHACQKEGTILNISSAGSFFPFPCFALYTATKAFVNQFSLSLDEELKHHGIRVLTACPGMVRTAFKQRSSKREDVIHSKHAMDPEDAARHLIWQIKKRKQLYIFNWKYRWGIRLSRLLPRSFLMKRLQKSIDLIASL